MLFFIETSSKQFFLSLLITGFTVVVYITGNANALLYLFTNIGRFAVGLSNSTSFNDSYKYKTPSLSPTHTILFPFISVPANFVKQPYFSKANNSKVKVGFTNYTNKKIFIYSFPLLFLSSKLSIQLVLLPLFLFVLSYFLYYGLKYFVYIIAAFSGNFYKWTSVSISDTTTFFFCYEVVLFG
jgi:hypothetical protein